WPPARRGSCHRRSRHPPWRTLDVLDSLRAHDRTVGLISHVPELRRRITQRLHISKNIDGSTITHLTEAAE
ncbi:hypothetical protein ABZ895_34550, partial [Streptomyces californicus]|uniref:hypothetical protein n=1 Tax=Streptomyces californicus TaxID=67351 RepID=UPI0033EDA18B